jgi:hypothetical protein
MLSCNGNVNSLSVIRSVELRQGENTTVYFQLVDMITGMRYVPAPGATVMFNIPRSKVVKGTLSNVRVVTDPTITRPATQPFVGDASIWSFPLIAADTSCMVSGGARLTLVEGAVTSMAALDFAFKVDPCDGVA